MTTETQTPAPAPSLLRRFTPALVPFLALFTALLIGAIIIWASGADPVAAYSALFAGALGSPTAIANTFAKATPYMIAGLAVALGFRSGLFNIGAEGQMYAGALVGVVLGTNPLTQNLPSFILIPLVILGGAVGGTLYGAIPGILKARTGAHEVINTIMLNFVAFRLTDWLIRSKDPIILRDPVATVDRTADVWAGATLPKLVSGTELHAGIIIAIGLVFLIWWLLFKTTIGFELRTVGTNPDAAKYAGMNVGRNIILAMALSGGLAGIAGVGEVVGGPGELTPGLFAGIGFDSIAVALLAKSNPIAIIPAALLWGGLLNGAQLMQIRASLSIDVIKMIQALIIMFVSADQIIRWLYRLRTKEGEGQAVFARGWGS